MRNIIIILASVCFISISVKSDEEVSDKDRKSCENFCRAYKNPYNEHKLIGVVQQDRKCHCMIYKGQVNAPLNTHCDNKCKIKLDENTRVYSTVQTETNKNKQCNCYQYLDCDPEYCHKFCRTQYKNKYIPDVYIQGHCVDGGRCRCEHVPHTECNGKSTIECNLKNLETGMSKLMSRANKEANKECEIEDGDENELCSSNTVRPCKCGDCHCNCYGGNNDTIIPNQVCNSCECKCTISNDCKSCFSCYGMGFGGCNKKYECENCMGCIYDCATENHKYYNVAGCALICYTDKENKFRPMVFANRNGEFSIEGEEEANKGEITTTPETSTHETTPETTPEENKTRMF